MKFTTKTHPKIKNTEAKGIKGGSFAGSMPKTPHKHLNIHPRPRKRGRSKNQSQESSTETEGTLFQPKAKIGESPLTFQRRQPSRSPDPSAKKAPETPIGQNRRIREERGERRERESERAREAIWWSEPHVLSRH